MPDIINLPPFPTPLAWDVQPAAWQLQDTALQITALPQSDPPMLNAARLLGEISGDLQLSARVQVAFAGTFDAGALLIWQDEHTWGKLCFEYSPDRDPMVVSVVTRTTSDDANGFIVQGDTVWLRISRLGQAIAFHASLDGQRWALIRHFGLALGETAKLGFVAQAPIGTGCNVTFDHIQFLPSRLADLRSGV
jgi:uncharacterized protein